MRNPLSTGIVTLALLATALPAPVHAFWGDPAEVTVPPARVGDQLRYEERFTYDGETDTRVFLVFVEGFAEARDRFGTLHPTQPFLVQDLNGTGVESAERCHILQGGEATVRRDVLVGDGHGTGTGWSTSAAIGNVRVHEESMTREGRVLTWFNDGSCVEHDLLESRTFREGDELTLGELWKAEADDEDLAPLRSSPAESVDFHGRPALRFHYDLTFPEAEDILGGALRLTVADGLPGFVRVDGELHVTLPEGERFAFTFERELTGHVAGDGPALSPPAGATLPVQSPEGAPVPFDGPTWDDAALGIPYPLEEAVEALRADPSVGFNRFLVVHPGAFLAEARYDRRMEPPDLPEAETDGGWLLTFADGNEAYMARTVRVTGTHGPMGPIESPVKLTRNEDVPTFSMRLQYAKPAKLPPSSALAGALTRHGFDPAALESFEYEAPMRHGEGPMRYVPALYDEPTFRVSDVSQDHPEASPSNEGTQYVFDGSGGLETIASLRAERKTNGLLPSFRGGQNFGSGDAAAATFLPVGPAAGAGLAAAGGLTLLALLAVLVKFLLVPMYTRLRRDRLLDNPVRARLYEHVRANGGVHLAQLVDYAGIGEGATRHHVDQLVRHGLLLEVKESGFVRYFAASEVPAPLAKREAVLRAGSNRRVYELYQAEPGITLREAAARLGISAPSVHRAVKRLRKAGLLTPAPDERVVRP